jgi:outer membrane lipoprotein-sorting protein
MFSTIILRITAAQWLVRQVELVEAKGDRTVVELKNIQVNR